MYMVAGGEIDPAAPTIKTATQGQSQPPAKGPNCPIGQTAPVNISNAPAMHRVHR